jgi:hypothetical protein
MKVLMLRYPVISASLLMFLSLIVVPAETWAAPARVYQKGTRVYLDNGTIKVGLELQWGGALVEFDMNGVNFVNDYDTGREVQVAFYDGDSSKLCNNCAGAKGWNPVQGGDWHKHGSPLLAKTLGTDSIYIKTQPHHWYPDNKAAGPNVPTPGDLYVEEWVNLVPNDPAAVKLHFKVTHSGKDRHTNSYQEFPAVYTNWAYGKLVYYGGTAPWTDAEVTTTNLPSPPNPSPTVYTPEQWAALVNNQGIGLTVYVPYQYPYVITNSHPATALPNSATNYFAPRTMFSFEPGAVLEGDIYLFGGNYRQARKTIYQLRKTISIKDPFTADGSMDAPKANASLQGTETVSGWTFDNVKVSRVDILVDEQVAGQATYGSARRDVSNKWPNAPENIGYAFKLDTSKFANGPHTVGVNVIDSAGNTAVFHRVPVSISNTTPRP